LKITKEGDTLRGKITVLGLGPGGKQYITVEAMDRIKEADVLYLRTQRHPVVEYIKKTGIKVESFDNIYDSSEDFDEVYTKIVDKLVAHSDTRDILYAVPGSPFVAENTEQKLIELSNKNKIELHFIAGVSFIETIHKNKYCYYSYYHPEKYIL